MLKSEIHSILSSIRNNDRLRQRFTSASRFLAEPIYKTASDPNAIDEQVFKDLYDCLETVEDIQELDARIYLTPFLNVIQSPDTNSAMTGM